MADELSGSVSGSENSFRLAMNLNRFRRELPCVKPTQVAVIIIDMQHAFRNLWNGPDKQKKLANLRCFIVAMRSLGCLIIRTQHGHGNSMADEGMLGVWWNSVILEGSRDHAFMSGFEVEPGDILITKNRYNAFLNTDLDAVLKKNQIQMVVIAGVMTNLCCETTAREAFCRDYHVSFLGDGTATISEEMHAGTILNLAFGFAHIHSCEFVIKWLNGTEVN